MTKRHELGLVIDELVTPERRLNAKQVARCRLLNELLAYKDRHPKAVVDGRSLLEASDAQLWAIAAKWDRFTASHDANPQIAAIIRRFTKELRTHLVSEDRLTCVR